jgi:DNA-binding transcriptional regulator YiaG
MIVRKLRAWRKRHGLSQQAAVEAMQARNYVVSVRTLQAWERGARKPGKLATQALKTFLEQAGP